MDANDTKLDRRDFIKTLAVVGVAAGALTLDAAPAEAAKCPKLPKPKVSKEIVPLHIDSEIGDSIDGQLDLRTVKTTPNPNTLSMELHFDRYEAGRHVRELTDKIETLALVHQDLHRPPRVLLTWGTGLAFKCIVESARTAYSLFLPDGTPVRAIMLVTLQVIDGCTLDAAGTP